MKTHLVFLMAIFTMLIPSCIVPAGGGYQQRSMSAGYGHPPMGRSGRTQHGNQRTGYGQPRQTDWTLGPVLHERWKYDSATGKTIKVSEESLNPDQARSQMLAKGLEAFPNRVPVGAEMPVIHSTRDKAQQ